MVASRLDTERTSIIRHIVNGDGDDARAFFQSEQTRLQNALSSLVVPPEPAPRAHLDLEALARFRDAPLSELRAAAELDPDAANEWARSVIERCEIWGDVVTVRLFGGLGK